MEAWRQRFQELWNRYTTRQRYIFLGVIAAILLAIFGISFWYGSKPDFVPLYTNLETKDAGDVVNSLKESGVQYQITETKRGSTIYVPATQVHDVRLELATAGLPRGNKGFELFDDSKLGVTEFQNKVNYLQALQGELTRTIEQIDVVQQARVHIVLPEDSLYKKNEKPATASIMLMLIPDMQITPDEVKGIVNLVSHSVQGLVPENVTVVDEAGHILNEQMDDDIMKRQRTNLQTLTQIEMTRQVRDQIQDNIQTLLDNTLGEGNAFARVSVELDFDTRSIDRQTFTPVVDESGIIRSQQDISETYDGQSNAAGGAAGAQGNIPGYVAEGGNSSNSNYERKESTKNYEVNEENQKVTSSPGSIKRLTVAVLVNDTVTALQQESLLRAVTSAAGINEDRGDTISVEPLPFNMEKRERELAETAAEKARKDRILYMEIGALILLVALIIGGVMMNRRKKQQVREIVEEARRVEEEKRRAEEEERRRIEEEQRALAIENDKIPDDSLTDEERQQREEKKTVLKLIDEKPADMAMLIKQWLSEDE